MNNWWNDKSMKGWKDKSMKGWKDKSMKWWKDERIKECTNQSFGLIFKVLCSLVWIITIERMNEWNKGRVKEKRFGTWKSGFLNVPFGTCWFMGLGGREWVNKGKERWKGIRYE